jgi:protein-S-isoprenylcysteine O-methyltransferase Ste14
MPTEKQSSAGAPTSAPPASPTRADSKNMLPPRERRRNPFERLLMRLVATCGVVAIGVAIAAIMTSSHSKGWIIGLVVSIVSVVLAAVLWSSRQL